VREMRGVRAGATVFDRIVLTKFLGRYSWFLKLDFNGPNSRWASLIELAYSIS
jgi:hypothetical protein